MNFIDTNNYQFNIVPCHLNLALVILDTTWKQVIIQVYEIMHEQFEGYDFKWKSNDRPRGHIGLTHLGLVNQYWFGKKVWAKKNPIQLTNNVFYNKTLNKLKFKWPWKLRNVKITTSNFLDFYKEQTRLPNKL